MFYVFTTVNTTAVVVVGLLITLLLNFINFLIYIDGSTIPSLHIRNTIPEGHFVSNNLILSLETYNAFSLKINNNLPI